MSWGLLPIEVPGDKGVAGLLVLQGRALDDGEILPAHGFRVFVVARDVKFWEDEYFRLLVGCYKFATPRLSVAKNKDSE